MVEEITEIVFGKLCAPEPCDLIFIFGGSHPGLWLTGAEAYHAGLGRTILATGGHKATAIRHHSWTHGTTPEAWIIRDELIARDVPSEAIYVEDRSTNSLENVRFAQAIYDFTPIESILVVCRSHGVGRQSRTLRRHIAPHVKLIPYPFDTNIGREGPVVTRYNWMTMESSRSGVFGQLLKIFQYGARDHITPVKAISDQLEKVVAEWLAAGGQ